MFIAVVANWAKITLSAVWYINLAFSVWFWSLSIYNAQARGGPAVIGGPNIAETDGLGGGGTIYFVTVRCVCARIDFMLWERFLNAVNFEDNYLMISS